MAEGRGVACAWSARMARPTGAPVERRLGALGAHLAASRPLPLVAAPAAAAMPRPQAEQCVAQLQAMQQTMQQLLRSPLQHQQEQQLQLHVQPYCRNSYFLQPISLATYVLRPCRPLNRGPWGRMAPI